MNEQASDQKATWSAVEDLAVQCVFVVPFKFKLHITLGVRCVMIEPTLTHFYTPFTPSKIRALHDRYQKFKVARTWSECWKILSTRVTGVGRGVVKCFRTTPSSTAGCESGIRHIFPLTAKYMWQPRGEGRCLALHWTIDRQTDS